MTVFAVLLAGGSSTRFRGSGNKLFARLPNGVNVWESAFHAFRNHPRIDGVGVVGNEATFSCVKPDFLVAGGATRAESSLLGVRTAPKGSMVLVHDAARPWPSGELIGRVIDAALEFGAAIPVLPVTDTLKRIENDGIESTVSRAGLFRAQTPQAAMREPLLAALEGNPGATDEASALEASGVHVRAVLGEESNRKITTPADLLQQSMMTITGFGFDVHAFSDDPSRQLMLGGIAFDDAPGLEGHSDADVLLHALTDALLGSIGGGDIGELFPNDDPANKNADSMLFLREAKQRIDLRGGWIISADLTLLAEIPKLSARRQQIRERISQELCVPERRINIKATTMEGLGAIGRREGIAAMATVTVALPPTINEE